MEVINMADDDGVCSLVRLTKIKMFSKFIDLLPELL